LKRIEKMIASVSSSSVALLRPTPAPFADDTSRDNAPAQPAASAAPAGAPTFGAKPSISPELNLVAQTGSDAEETTIPGSEEAQAEETTGKDGQSKPAEGQGSETKGADGQALSEEEQAQLAKLRARDREVHAHEQAHVAAGAGLAGAPSYSYENGPDGKQYAVGGEVGIRTTASGGNPRQQAPASPSGQDRSVAANARAQAAQIQAQLARDAQAKAQETLKSSTDKAQADAEDEGAPAESKPLLPELPHVALSKVTGAGDSDTDNEGPKKGGVVQPIAASVIGPPAKKSSSSFGGAEHGGDVGHASSASGISSSIAAYQQNGASSKNGNQIKPLTPSLGGSISLSA
jgi:hypothetical protein